MKPPALAVAFPLLITLVWANPNAAPDANADPDAQIASQQPSGGDIDFTTYSTYKSFRACLKRIFAPYESFGMTIPGELVGCITNECLCQPANIASNLPMLYSTASRECSNTIDATSATQILDGYCSDAGYTAREGEVAETTGGAGATQPKATAAVTTATEKVTKTLAGGGVVTETTVVVTEGEASPVAGGSSPTNNDKNNDLSVGSIVGIVVGVLGFIATSVGVYFGYQQYRNSHPAPVVGTQPEQVGMMERGVVYGQGGNPSGFANQGYGYNNTYNGVYRSELR